MSQFRLAAIAALVLAASGHSARAGFIQQVDTYDRMNTPFATPLTFNSFNTALGTLNEVVVTVTENGSVTSDVYNFNGNASTYTNASSTGLVTVTGPDLTTVTSSISTVASSGSIAAGFQMVQAGMTSDAQASATTSITSELSGYEGTAGLTYTVDAVGSVTSQGTSPSGSISFGGVAAVGGTVEIDYLYSSPPSAVPEPASLVMVALGLGGVLAARRFRRRVA